MSDYVVGIEKPRRTIANSCDLLWRRCQWVSPITQAQIRFALTFSLTVSRLSEFQFTIRYRVLLADDHVMFAQRTGPKVAAWLRGEGHEIFSIKLFICRPGSDINLLTVRSRQY